MNVQRYREVNGVRREENPCNPSRIEGMVMLKKGYSIQRFPSGRGKSNECCKRSAGGTGAIYRMQLANWPPAPSHVHTRRQQAPTKQGTHVQALLKEAHKRPTRCRKLVLGDPDLIGIMDAAKKGTSGVVIGEMMPVSQWSLGWNGHQKSKHWYALTRTQQVLLQTWISTL